MFYFLALVPATILTIAGYGVLYLAHRSEGASSRLASTSGFWAFTLAVLVILAPSLPPPAARDARHDDAWL